jgi:hypothetical protein
VACEEGASSIDWMLGECMSIEREGVSTAGALPPSLVVTTTVFVSACIETSITGNSCYHAPAVGTTAPGVITTAGTETPVGLPASASATSEVPGSSMAPAPPSSSSTPSSATTSFESSASESSTTTS